MTTKDQKLLAEMYENAVVNQRPEFVQSIRRSFGHLRPDFGIEDQGEKKGKMFAIMSVTYDEGDRWGYDTRVIYDGEGYNEGYSDEEVNRLYALTKKHPELNK